MDRPCVLEPSAGRGSIVDAVRRANRLAHITAHEIDPDRVTFLQAIKSANVVHAGDFLAWDVPSRPYDVAIGNTPYEGGADGFFLERMMACSNVVVPLLRINAMTGKARHDRIWSRVRAGEWHLSDLRYLEKRPEFDGPGEDSAMSDYVVVKLVRAEPGGRPRPTMVDWW